MAYSFNKPYVEEKVGKARLEGVDASFKDLTEVCGNIRGLSVEKAFSLLEEAKAMKRPILYRSHNKKLGHRRELGGKKGRYPVKAVTIVLKVLKSAVANALNKGLEESSLIVLHAAANKKEHYPRLQPKGRRMRHDYETARVEIIVGPKEALEVKSSQEKG